MQPKYQKKCYTFDTTYPQTVKVAEYEAPLSIR